MVLHNLTRIREIASDSYEKSLECSESYAIFETIKVNYKVSYSGAQIQMIHSFASNVVFVFSSIRLHNKRILDVLELHCYHFFAGGNTFAYIYIPHGLRSNKLCQSNTV